MREALRRMIDRSENIVFFGGAGVSTESGIPDFRGSGGLYNQKQEYSPETILSNWFFMEHTEAFYAFYKEKMLFPAAKPNKAHFALSELERAGKLKAVVTQNIDGFHQAAGSKNVLELHGSVHRNFCMRCDKRYELAYIRSADGVPICSCGGIVKPDVVLYGEPLNDRTVALCVQYIRRADMLIIGGTSLTVYPAAGLIDYYRGDRLVLINQSATAADERANLVVNQPIGEVLGSLYA